MPEDVYIKVGKALTTHQGVMVCERMQMVSLSWGEAQISKIWETDLN